MTTAPLQFTWEGLTMSQTKQRRDLYQEVTDKIIAAIESGTAPWQRGWSELAELGLPVDFHANLTPVFHSILTPPVAV